MVKSLEPVEALAHQAIEADLRVAWFTLETLTATISRAKADGSTARTITRICRSDLIVVDDIGMLPAGQDAAEAFYRVVDAAYERRSIAVTSSRCRRCSRFMWTAITAWADGTSSSG